MMSPDTRIEIGEAFAKAGAARPARRDLSGIGNLPLRLPRHLFISARKIRRSGLR
jgi:hypothetical protein